MAPREDTLGGARVVRPAMGTLRFAHPSIIWDRVRMRTPRAIVIGAGFGGLAAAVRLRALGYEVQVLEALDQAGGRARVFRRDGFTFDAGPTVITAPYLLAELFALVGRRMEDYVRMVPVDPFYRILFADGSSFDYVQDEERLLAQIAALSPR